MIAQNLRPVRSRLIKNLPASISSENATKIQDRYITHLSTAIAYNQVRNLPIFREELSTLFDAETIASMWARAEVIAETKRPESASASNPEADPYTHIPPMSGGSHAAQIRTTSKTLNELLDDRERMNRDDATPSIIDVLNRTIDGAHRDLSYDRKPWPAHLCPACLATIEPSDSFCPGCGSPTNDAIAQILRAPFPGTVDTKMRQQGRKEFAAAVRSILKTYKIKGVSVTAPNYSMAMSIEVRIKDADRGHAFDERFRSDDSGYPMPHQHRTCPRCQRIHNAEHKLTQMILCAFPDCDDRSDSMTDYFDYRFHVSA